MIGLWSVDRSAIDYIILEQIKRMKAIGWTSGSSFGNQFVVLEQPKKMKAIGWTIGSSSDKQSQRSRNHSEWSAHRSVKRAELPEFRMNTIGRSIGRSFSNWSHKGCDVRIKRNDRFAINQSFSDRSFPKQKKTSCFLAVRRWQKLEMESQWLYSWRGCSMTIKGGLRGVF